MRLVVPVLVVDGCDAVRNALTAIREVPGFDGVTLGWSEASSSSDGMALLDGDPRVVLVEPALENAQDRSGMSVVYAACQRGARVLVHTTQRLDDKLQDQLVELAVPVLTKPFDSVRLASRVARVAVGVRRNAEEVTHDALEHIAEMLLGLRGRISANTKQAVAIAVDKARREAGSKLGASRRVGEDRKYVDRALLYLPLKKAGRA